MRVWESLGRHRTHQGNVRGEKIPQGSQDCGLFSPNETRGTLECGVGLADLPPHDHLSPDHKCHEATVRLLRAENNLITRKPDALPRRPAHL